MFKIKIVSVAEANGRHEMIELIKHLKFSTQLIYLLLIAT